MNGQQTYNLPYKFKSDLTSEDIQKIIAEETRKSAEVLRAEFDKILRIKDQQIIEKDKELREIGVGSPGLETGSKIAKMIEEIKKRKAAGMMQPITCPTCGDNDGHTHEMILQPDGSFKCTGPECRAEKIMVDKAADYKCVGCGMPIKRPLNQEKALKDTCIWCGSKKAVKFDWSAKFKKLRGNLESRS